MVQQNLVDWVVYLLDGEDEDLPEPLDEVDEEVQRVGNKVPVSVSGLAQYITIFLRV